LVDVGRDVDDVVPLVLRGRHGTVEALRAAGATVVPVAIDGDGLDVTALTTLANRSKLRAVYVTPHH
jgi:GntR family transcriptional regulator/MocR family aminotransferase